MGVYKIVPLYLRRTVLSFSAKNRLLIDHSIRIELISAAMGV